MRRLYVNRYYTNLVGVVPLQARDKYRPLVTITDSGQSTLTPAFTQAIDNVGTAADAAYQQHLGNLAARIAQGRRPVYEQRADSAKEAEREEAEGLVEAQRAAREEDGEEEEGVPEDESLPPRGGATCPHPHRGGGQIENTVYTLKSE